MAFRLMLKFYGFSIIRKIYMYIVHIYLLKGVPNAEVRGVRGVLGVLGVLGVPDFGVNSRSKFSISMDSPLPKG